VDKDALPAISFTATPWTALESDVAAWDALAANATEPNPFFESWFLLPALRAFSGGLDIRIMRLDVGGKLVGLMPLARRSRYYHLPLPNMGTWIHANCFLGAPLVSKGHEDAFWRALLEWADARPGMSLFLHLPHLPLDGPLHASLTAILREQNRYSALVFREERAMLSSTLSAEEYLRQALSTKKRKELRRQYNRLEDEGDVRFERYRDATQLAQWTEAFLKLEAAGWKGEAGSALRCDPSTESLFREALTGAAQQDRLERLTLSVDGRPLAMLATFLTPPGAFSFKTSFDEDFARLSPGVLLQRENLAILDDPAIAWTDSCATSDHPMIDRIWRERRPVGRLSIAIGGAARRTLFRGISLAEMARQGSPDSPSGNEA
jgi:CelD/BcsL family acetyltransferase involved in cellulose biosynthesis